MTSLIENISSWHGLLILGAILVLYGFMPGFLLRLTVLMYPKEDPRRRELVAELYTIPRRERPLWVFEQLETALFEGLLSRLGRWVRKMLTANFRSKFLACVALIVLLCIAAEPNTLAKWSTIAACCGIGLEMAYIARFLRRRPDIATGRRKVIIATPLSAGPVFFPIAWFWIEGHDLASLPTAAIVVYGLLVVAIGILGVEFLPNLKRRISPQGHSLNSLK